MAETASLSPTSISLNIAATVQDAIFSGLNQSIVDAQKEPRINAGKSSKDEMVSNSVDVAKVKTNKIVLQKATEQANSAIASFDNILKVNDIYAVEEEVALIETMLIYSTGF